jgi:hypothetical protein
VRGGKMSEVRPVAGRSSFAREAWRA